jgi:hypothetical protein
VAGTEHTPGEHPNSDHSKQEQPRNKSRRHGSTTGGHSDEVQEGVDGTPVLPSRDHTAPIPNKDDPENKPLGTRIDMTA